MARQEGEMLRRLLTFAASLAAHAAATFVLLDFAGYTGLPELLFWIMFIPWHLLGQTREGHPDLGALVGVPEDSPLSPYLCVSVNSLLWVAGACVLWVAGRWAWRKVVRVCARASRLQDDTT
jgi:hypothetical protein